MGPLILHMAHNIELQLYGRGSYEMRLESPHHMLRPMALHNYEPMPGNFISQGGIMEQWTGKCIWKA